MTVLRLGQYGRPSLATAGLLVIFMCSFCDVIHSAFPRFSRVCQLLLIATLARQRSTAGRVCTVHRCRVVSRLRSVCCILSGVQNVRVLTQFITVGTFSVTFQPSRHCNWHALGPAFLQSSDSVVEELFILLFS